MTEASIWRILFAASAIVVIGVFLPIAAWRSWTRSQHAAAFAPIALEMAELVDDCRTASYPDFERGQELPSVSDRKAIVWWTESKTLADAHWLLPDEDRADPGDESLAMVLVVNRESALVGKYGGKDDSPAFRQRADLCIVLWPERKLVGRTYVQSDPLPERGVGPKHGDLDPPIARWVASFVEN